MAPGALAEEQCKRVTCLDEELPLRACVGICVINTWCKAVKAILLEVADLFTWFQQIVRSEDHHRASTHGSACPASPQCWPSDWAEAL